jgi:hypothetical protein
MSILDRLRPGDAPMIVPLSAVQYHQMIAQGILREGEAIELIDGLLIRKDRADRGGDPMSHGPRHAAGVKRLLRPFRRVEELGYHLHSQLPVTLGDNQEPEPDLAVVRGQAEDYDRRRPAATDIAAIMEVSDSSLSFDRTTKLRIYANASIPIYVIVNLVDGQIEMYQGPAAENGSYAVRTDYHAGQFVRIALAVDLEIEISVADLFPA